MVYQMSCNIFVNIWFDALEILAHGIYLDAQYGVVV